MTKSEADTVSAQSREEGKLRFVLSADSQRLYEPRFKEGSTMSSGVRNPLREKPISQFGLRSTLSTSLPAPKQPKRQRAVLCKMEQTPGL